MAVIPLTVAYPLAAAKITDEQRNYARREISKQIILGAANCVYAQGMTLAESRIFAAIWSQLDGNDLVLTPETKTMMQELFFSQAAEDLIRFKPDVVHWAVQWMDHLEPYLA